MIAVESVKNEMFQVRRRLAELMRCGDPLVDGCLTEIADRQGKMVRPLLLLLFAKAGGAISPLHINLAAVVELIHTASLLHDDVIDQAALRRNRATANVLWGNTAAVLLGDMLLSKAFSQMARDVPQEAVTILCGTAETLCRGELRQNLLRGRFDLTQEQYFDLIEAKTAALFGCACRLAMTVGCAEDSRIEAAGAYGRDLGMAFQIMDDLRDIRSTPQREGKTLGTDLLHEKLTLPVLYWIDQNPEERESRIQQLSLRSAEELTHFVVESGCFERAYCTAKEYSRAAVGRLEVFERCPGREDLAALAEEIVRPVS